jgi:putative YhdH/YhfP family quinone oxidoreductase
LAAGHDLGVAHHGGYAELARVPGDWLVPLPAGLSLWDAMALGTAGFTTALAVTRLEQNGLTPAEGPVLVSGATGGVGSLSVAALARLGYRVTALTRKTHEGPYLERLGAAETLSPDMLDLGSIRPLGKATWAGAVDNVGGDVLAWIISTMKPNGAIASIGLARSATLATTVLPFILRGVNLLGIDSVMTPIERRRTVWQRIASDLRPGDLDRIGHDISLDELDGVLTAILNGQAQGRWVVDVRR